jgi:benzodiazapine receptor
VDPDLRAGRPGRRGTAWQAAHRTLAQRQRVLLLFSLNAFLNVFWSLLFFRLQRPDLALIEVGFLWLSIVALILGSAIDVAARRRGTCCPTWPGSSFAAVLNAEVVRLNPGF